MLTKFFLPAAFFSIVQVITLGPDDSILGSASKRISHVFDENQPRGILHRAFSLFLFDKESGDLLLQKRASTKITFPNVRHLLSLNNTLECYWVLCFLTL